MTSNVNRIRRTDVQRCEATTKGQWYAEPHQCPYAAITNLDGEWLCKIHADQWARGEGLSQQQEPSK